LPEPKSDDLEVDNPVVVVEVLSPSTARMDGTTKLNGHFKVPSIQHYPIVDPGECTGITGAGETGPSGGAWSARGR
jgi:Uma2 family endonuclease